jgi:shikimate kinase
MSNQTIIIIGFMGCGKTTVANELARLRNCRAVDLDSWISEHEQRAPGKIIEREGEEAFRRIETQALREVLREESASVVAVGGGAWTVAENRQLIAQQGAFTIWLDCLFEVCWQRIEAEHEVRPLARSREVAETLFAARRPLYALADVRIPVAESDSVEGIAQKVVGAIVS